VFAWSGFKVFFLTTQTVKFCCNRKPGMWKCIPFDLIFGFLKYKKYFNGFLEEKKVYMFKKNGSPSQNDTLFKNGKIVRKKVETQKWNVIFSF